MVDSVTLIIPSNKIGARTVAKLISSEQLAKIRQNGYFKTESAKEVTIGVRETENSILLFTIDKTPLDTTPAHPYQVQYCNNDGTQQLRARPDDKTPPEEQKSWGPYYSYGGSGGVIKPETLEAILKAPKDILKTLEFKTPVLKELNKESSKDTADDFSTF